MRSANNGDVSRSGRRHPRNSKGLISGARVAVAVGLTVAVASATWADGATPAGRVFTAQDIFALKHADDVQISPDGRHIAFVQVAGDIATDRDHSTLWMVETSGDAPRRLVAGDASDPRWSPDGTRIAYLADDADKRTQVHVLSLATGTDTTITQSSEAPQSITWSPDSLAIAFTAFVPAPEQTLATPLVKPAGATWAPPLRFTTAKHVTADGSGYVQPGHDHLFLARADGGEVRQLTSGPGEDEAPSWTPDGRALVFASKIENAQLLDFNADRIHRLDLETGKVTRLSPDPITASQPVVSPDGRHIAFVGYVEPHPGDFFPIDIYVMDSDGTHAHVLDPALDRLADDPQWTPDGAAVLADYVDHGVEKVGRFGVDGSFRVLAHDLDGAFSAAQTGALAFPLASPNHPDDVGAVREGHQDRLTDLNAALLGGLKLATVRPLPVRSSLDGAEVGAWVMLPPGYDPARRWPTILEIHGGPYGYDGPQWRTDSQVFTGAGYVVLYVNYRGSTSYGLKFSTLIDRDFPGPAYVDLMSAVDAAVAAGIADPARLFVTGGSAGGELTAWTVGKTHRFCAAVAEKPVIDLISSSLTTDQYLFDATENFGTTPWADPMRFWTHSALSLVGEVTTPTLLIVGDEDRRTPLSQSLEFYNALTIRGVPTGLVIVPGASHESLESRPSQRAAEDLAILAWFARYGRPGGDSAAPARPQAYLSHPR